MNIQKGKKIITKSVYSTILIDTIENIFELDKGGLLDEC